MRRVHKDLNDKPAILLRESVLALLEKICADEDPSQIKDDHYYDPYPDTNNQTQSRVRDKLNEYYFYKCAYCESYCKAQIEHYRPQKGVTGAKNHPGYYWLCYEWSNLVPSCPDCNTYGGKGNQFPVRGPRVTVPVFGGDGKLDVAHSLASSAYLQKEKPYLLHPELDDPIEYLALELDAQGKGIQLKGIDGENERGNQTIRICNLNRTSLKIGRLETIEDFVTSINEKFKMLAEGILPPENLRKALFKPFEQLDEDKDDENKPFTFVCRFVMESPANFEAIVLPLLLESQQAIVRETFMQYRLRPTD